MAYFGRMITKLDTAPTLEDASCEPSKDVKVPFLSTTGFVEVFAGNEELVAGQYEITPTSASLFLWNGSSHYGYSIDYAFIILFAMESGAGIYMQIGKSTSEDSPIEVRFRTEQTQELYDALSRAAAFHDVVLESEDETIADIPTNGVFEDPGDVADQPPLKHQRRE